MGARTGTPMNTFPSFSDLFVPTVIEFINLKAALTGR